MRSVDRVDSEIIYPKIEISNTREHNFEVKGEKIKGD